MKIDAYYQRQRCSAMTVFSGNIRFMRIFAGGGGNQKRRFSRLSDATSSAPQEMRPTLLYSIIQSLVAFPLTPKYMTLKCLNDLENLNGHFTLNFHYYEERFSNQVTYLLQSVFTHVTNGDVRKQTVIRRIYGIREKYGSFVDATSSEP